MIFVILLSFGFVVGGCVLIPKATVMKTAIARTTSRRTSVPRVFQTGPGQLIAVGQEETVSTEVDYSKATPVSASRSIWSRWYFWLLILGGVTYLGLWPIVFKLLKKLREKTHALVNVVRNVENFKTRAENEPGKGTVEELRERLKEQDPVTQQAVKEAKANNGE